MKQNHSTRYLILSIVLILLACIRYEYRTDQWELSTPGLQGGIGILAIIGLVLVFRIFSVVQDVCLAHGLIESRISSKYDLLIPIALVAVMFYGHWTGDLVEGMDGEEVYQWEFAWSDPEYAGPFLAALLVVVLLLRVQTLLRAIKSQAKERGESETSVK